MFWVWGFRVKGFRVEGLSVLGFRVVRFSDTPNASDFLPEKLRGGGAETR